MQNICSWGMVSWKIVSVLTKFWESSPGKFICSYGFFPPRKSYVFLRNFEKALREILICSSTFCLSWKIWSLFKKVAPEKKYILAKQLDSCFWAVHVNYGHISTYACMLIILTNNLRRHCLMNIFLLINDKFSSAKISSFKALIPRRKM